MSCRWFNFSEVKGEWEEQKRLLYLSGCLQIADRICTKGLSRSSAKKILRLEYKSISRQKGESPGSVWKNGHWKFSCFPLHSAKTDSLWPKGNSGVGEVGSIALWLVYLLPDPAVPCSNPIILKKISEEKIIIVAEVNQRRLLEESGQWLENYNQTHLGLAIGKPVLNSGVGWRISRVI